MACIVKKNKIWWCASALLMAIAVAARELDLVLCSHFTNGTHYIWHIASGLSLYGPIMFLKNSKTNS
ncbi:MAG: hypothetical protein AAF153_02750 [Pseudomonadota bacterium]